MRIGFLSLLVIFCLYFVAGQPEGGEGTCSAQDGGTCGSASNEVCFPDGSCFGSLAEAVSHYQGSTGVIPMKVPKSYGEAQLVDAQDPTTYENTLEHLAQTHHYMTNLYRNETAKAFRDECKLTHESCTFWASIGECEANPKYMILNCAPACQTCELLSFDFRCPFDRNAPKAWGPGDLNKMFERLTTEKYYVDKYEPTILSQPPTGPWLITLENVLSEEEAQRLIQLGGDRGYERSTDVGKRKFDGRFDSKLQDTRTSHNTWCLDECYTSETTQTVLRNLENITGIPDTNSEYLQLLRYEETQRYARHHDFVPFHLERYQGPRLMTAFLYLNDVEEGGGTHFNNLGITVQPKTGRAVLWPSVTDHDPDAKEYRTDHEALPVIKGVKYAANAWIHARSFKEVFETGCD